MKERLKILFFNPPIFSDGTIPRELIANDNLQNREVPRGLLSIVSFLQKAGIPSRAIMTDSFFEKPLSQKDLLFLGMKKLICDKVDEYDPEFIGFSLMFGFVEKSVIAMTSFTKEAFPQKKIIVGGNHASFVTHRLLAKHTGIDIVVRGEGERTLQEIIEGRNLSGIKGISFRDDSCGQIIHTSDRHNLPISDFPSNDYSLLETGEGTDICHFNHTIQHSRGCSFSCSFCTSQKMWKGRVRSLKYDCFKSELRTVLGFNNRISDSSITVIMDDDLFSSERYWSPMFSAMEECRQDFPHARYVAQARVSNVRRNDLQTNKMLDRAQTLGLQAVFLGIESGSQAILDAMNKRCKVEWIEAACKNLRDHGIHPAAFWMFGHPGATVEEEKKSIELMEHLLSQGLLSIIEPHLTIPFPGTKMRTDPRIKMLVSEDSEIDHYAIIGEKEPVHCLVDPNTNRMIMSPEQITEAYLAGLKVEEAYLSKEVGLQNIISFFDGE